MKQSPELPVSLSEVGQIVPRHRQRAVCVNRKMRGQCNVDCGFDQIRQFLDRASYLISAREGGVSSIHCISAIEQIS